MINKLRVRAQSDSGFTLVELLVVMLILGLLAAIAIPAFFNQRTKAQDAEAKSQAKTAQTAIETYATDVSTGYANATKALLWGIEPTLPSTGSGGGTFALSNLAAKTYTITATSSSGNTFSITRNADGTIAYPCTPTGGGGGCPGSQGWG
jgi:type IV pilus assembly protein PilA